MIKSFSWMILGAAAAQVLLPAVPAHAQRGRQDNRSFAGQQENGSFALRLDVRRVPVDVVVLDEAGNPVRGLTQNDFNVKEDGKPQRILSFEWFDGGTQYTPPKLPPLPANTFVNVPSSPEKGPLYVIYYDMVNTSPQHQMEFRRELDKFVQNAPEGVRIALFVNATGLHMLQGFTSDRAQLQRAVVQKGPGPHIPQVFLNGNTFGANDAGGALSNLTFMAQYLEGIPGRKNLIWMADNFPIPVAATMLGNAQIQSASAAPQWYSVEAQGGPQILDLSSLMKDAVQHTWASLMRAQVALYPLSLRGVSGTDHAGEEADAVVDNQLAGMIATATGGHAFAGSNRQSSLIEKAIEHGSSYYSLSYAPTNTSYDGNTRTVLVQLKRKGKYKLSYRTTYCALSDDEAAKQKRGDELQERFVKVKQSDNLYANIEHGAPMLHDVVFSAHLAKTGEPHMATPEQMRDIEDSPQYFQTRRRHPNKKITPVKLQKFAIDYNLVDPVVRTALGRHDKAVVLEFAAAAYNADGLLLNSILNKGVPNDDTAAGGGRFHALQELEAPEGTAYIRLAVRDTTNNRTGTLEVSLPLKDDGILAQK